jgi:hypothetical protein
MLSIQIWRVLGASVTMLSSTSLPLTQPIWRQITSATLSSTFWSGPVAYVSSSVLLLQIVPHMPFLRTSTRPSRAKFP